ncbi:hypothetical protein HID58_059701, partial [Brassica napus]
TSRNFTIEDKCDYTVWPVASTLSSVGFSLSPTGFIPRKGEAGVINAPPSWTGRFWAGHSAPPTQPEVSHAPQETAVPEKSSAPDTDYLFPEFALDGATGKDSYDVSVVAGYNLPMQIVPLDEKTCSSTGCVMDLKVTCPFELRVTTTNTSLVACMNACQKLKLPEYCCTGDYSSPDKCKPSLYSQNFKSVSQALIATSTTIAPS